MHFRLREDKAYIAFPEMQVANVTLCRINLDEQPETQTTRDWEQVTCPKCKEEKAECDKIGDKILNSLKAEEKK